MKRFIAVVAASLLAWTVPAPASAEVPSFVSTLEGQVFARDVAVDEAGNIYVVGAFGGTGDFDPSAAVFNLTSTSLQTDAFVVKLSPTGALIWAKAVGGTGGESAAAVAVDSAGNVHAAGSFDSVGADFDPGLATSSLSSAGGSDAYVLTLTNAGDFSRVQKVGGSGSDFYADVQVDSADNVLLTGGFNGSVDFDPLGGVAFMTSIGGFDVFVQKLNNAGTLLWARRAGGSDADGGVALAVDAGGGVVVVGTFETTADLDTGTGSSEVYNLISAGDFDVFVLRLDGSGNFKWAVGRGSTDFDESTGVAIFQTEIYVTAWYGHADLSRLDLATGDTVFAKRWGQATETADALAVDATGVHVIGEFGGTVDLDPSSGTRLLTETGTGLNMYRSVFGRDGSFREAGAISSSTRSIPEAIALGPETIVGGFGGTTDFDPGPGSLTRTGPAFPSTYTFVLRLVPDPRITINNVRTTEGDGARKNFTFRVRIDKAVAVPVSVAFTTANGTAKSGSDYIAKSGTAVIPAGQLSKTLSIAVVGGQVREPNETFQVRLRSPVSGVIADATGLATIVNDD